MQLLLMQLRPRGFQVEHRGRGTTPALSVVRCPIFGQMKTWLIQVRHGGGVASSHLTATWSNSLCLSEVWVIGCLVWSCDELVTCCVTLPSP